MNINIWSKEIPYVGLLVGNSNNGCLHFGHSDPSRRLKASAASALKAWRIPGERLVFSPCWRLKKLETEEAGFPRQWKTAAVAAKTKSMDLTASDGLDSQREGRKAKACFPQTSLCLGSLGENGWPLWGKVYLLQLSFPGNAQQAICTAGLLVGSRLTTSLTHSVVLNKASSQRVLNTLCNYYEGVCLLPSGGQIWLWINFDFKNTKQCDCNCQPIVVKWRCAVLLGERRYRKFIFDPNCDFGIKEGTPDWRGCWRLLGMLPRGRASRNPSKHAVGSA